MKEAVREFDIEDRLIDFAVQIIHVSDALPMNIVGRHVGKQIIRSGTSPASNYGEAQSAESRSDFIHKIKICLKELRETRVWLKMIIRAKLIKSTFNIEAIINESDELISIFVASVKTAAQNKRKTS
ncbi:MAG: four helix bundle protein [Deltaproteobacteria bacterium]|nr:four helix bundle protein [Deltaproteobacteria bacterium]MBW1815989.1 four helix bundle protein [Deltaproteobacteria bacterium]